MGGEYALFVQIGTAVLVILFLVAVAFSVRTWRFPHVFFLVLTFFGAGVFMVFASMVLKTHQAWRTEVNKLETDLQRRVAEAEALQHGDVKTVEEEPNLRGVKAALARVTLDRGRVWKNCVPGNFDGTSVTVQTGAAAGAPAGRPNGIEANAVLYVFKQATTPDNYRLPVIYLGEFKVTAATDTSVTLSPNVPLDAQQQQQIRVADLPWMLYEVMPIDAREHFAGLPEAELRNLMPSNNQISQASYDAMIRAYVRSGGPAEQTDLPEETWVKVKFLKKKTIDVDSDQPPTPEMYFFDSQGRAIALALKRSKPNEPADPVEFDPGDTILVNFETAEQWVAAGDVERQENVYLRPLNDYAQLFHEHARRSGELRESIGIVTRDTASVNDSISKVQSQTQLRETEKSKLQQDVDNLKLERDLITQYEADLKQQSDELRQKLRETYLLNIQLAEELAQLQRELAERLEEAPVSRTAAVVK